MSWSTQKIAAITGGTYTGKDTPVEAIHTDSREIQKGDCFIALKGETDDGHRFVKGVLDRGAAAAVVSTLVTDADPTRQIIVPQTMTAFRKMALSRREVLSAKVIGLTGSAGKTTTKEMLRHVLGAYAPTYASEKSYNNHVGVPISLTNCPIDVTYAVFEMGMNHKGEISPLTALVKPHIAIVTNVYPVHIGNLGSLENIAAAKAEIFEGLVPEGIALINGDTEPLSILVEKATAYTKNIVTFGEGTANQVVFKEVRSKGEGIDVRASLFQEEISYYIPIKGKHYGMNALIALATVKLLGLSREKAIEALRHFYPVSNRGALKSFSLPQGEITVIDESYNANPVAVKCALERLREIGQGHRKVFIFGQMGELGERGKCYHQDLMPLINEAGVDLLHVVGGEEAKALYEMCSPSQKGIYAETVEGLLPNVLETFIPGDVVLVKGSLSRNLGHIIKVFEEVSVKEKNHAL